MPARPKTNDAQIVQAACDLVEARGRDGFSMNDVAAAVGVRAPSLYKRFKDRANLLAAVELQLWADLAEMLANAVIEHDAEASVMALAKAIRAFATAHPNSYSLFFDIRSEPTEAGTTARGAAVAHLLAPLGVLVGPDRAFATARALVPFLHGFISMQLANGFRLGPDLDVAFENGVTLILSGAANRNRIDA